MKSLIDTLSHCLCPPGNGVFTVNTAKERKEQLHLALYNQKNDIEAIWLASLEKIPIGSNAIILGIASDCGGGILRGANWGPLFLRSYLLELYPDIKAFDLGDVRVIPHLLHDKYLNKSTLSNCRKALYANQESHYPVSPLSLTEYVLDEFYNKFPNKHIFGIGGDHSISYPLTKTYLKAKQQQNKRVAIIHFDAHTDLLKERLGIDLCFGSWCTHILEYLNSPSHLIQLGIRSSGKAKSHWQNTFGVKQYWAEEIQELGTQKIISEILHQLKSDDIDELYVSFDIDALDDEYASATGTPEPNGLTPTQVMDILQSLAAEIPITGADMMELAPFTDSSGKGEISTKTTFNIAAKISAFLLNELSK